MLWLNLWVVAGLSMMAGQAGGQEAPQGSRPSTVIEETPPPAAASPEVAASQQSDKAVREAEAAARLNGTQWAIELTPMSGQKPKRPMKDTLRFEQGQITSEQLSTTGYSTSNYTLTVGDDGVPVWETMQTSKAKGVVFWRGELHGDTMRGILSEHPLEGTAQDHSFIGQRASAAMAPSEPSPSVETQPQPQPDLTPPQPEETKPKKAREGWFR